MKLSSQLQQGRERLLLVAQAPYAHDWRATETKLQSAHYLVFREAGTRTL
jgi:hypothetical protein